MRNTIAFGRSKQNSYTGGWQMMPCVRARLNSRTGASPAGSIPIFTRSGTQKKLRKRDSAALLNGRERAAKRRKPIPYNWLSKRYADRPSTTLRQLEQQLRALERIEVIDEIADDLISFTAANGRFKGAKLSGLKHRISRAKKKPRSR